MGRSLREVAAAPYWRAEDAAVVVRAWRQSGQTLAGFCRRHGVAPKRVRSWVPRVDEAELGSVSFREVVVVDDASGSPSDLAHVAELVVAEGWRLRVPVGFDEAELGRLLVLLRSC